MTASEPNTLVHSAFYRFVSLADPSAAASAVRALAGGLGLRGSIVLAHEGISGAVAGTAAAVSAFEAALRQGAVPGPAAQRRAPRPVAAPPRRPTPRPQCRPRRR